MAKIVFTMDNGEKFSLSRWISHSDKGEYQSQSQASFDIKQILDDYSRFTADDGTILISKHIATAKITD